MAFCNASSARNEGLYGFCAAYDTAYRFGFNGKEKDDEVKGNGNSLDFGARIFDPRVGRWLSMDPLAAKYPDQSPYSFAGNSPIAFLDPDGEKIIIHYDSGKRDKSGNPIMKQYEYGAKLDVPNNVFVQQTVAALDMIAAVNTVSNGKNDPVKFPSPSDMLTTLTADQGKTLNIILSSDLGTHHTPPKNLSGSVNSTQIEFAPFGGKYTKDVSPGGNEQDGLGNTLFQTALPPASGLNHDLKHAYNLF